MDWHKTWLLWIINALIEEIVKLIFVLKGVKEDKKNNKSLIITLIILF